MKHFSKHDLLWKPARHVAGKVELLSTSQVMQGFIGLQKVALTPVTLMQCLVMLRRYRPRCRTEWRVSGQRRP